MEGAEVTEVAASEGVFGCHGDSMELLDGVCMDCEV